MKYYKDALYIAARQAYKDEVIDTGMEDLTIGENMDFSSKYEWISARVQEWLDEAEIERTP